MGCELYRRILAARSALVNDEASRWWGSLACCKSKGEQSREGDENPHIRRWKRLRMYRRAEERL